MRELAIVLVTVFVIDYTGFVEQGKRWLHGLLYKKTPYRHFRLKPLDCSLCMTFWLVLIFSEQEIYTRLIIATLLAYSTEIVNAILITISTKLRTWLTRLN